MTVLRHRLTWIVIAMVLTATALALLLRSPRKEGSFHVPDAVEARAAEAMFARALASGDLRGSTDFELEAGQLELPAGLSLAEPNGTCTGRGAYLFRTDPASIPVALTAPHRGADRLTGELAGALFEEHPFAAAAWNSAPRRGGEDCPHSGDIARLPTHYLTAFSLAFAQRHPLGRVIQLHGFDHARRNSLAAAEAGMILSDGSRDPSERLLDLADCLTGAFPDTKVAVFPIASDELGATTNAQGRALRAAGFTGFSHLELSESMRRRLMRNAEDRARLAACFGARL